MSEPPPPPPDDAFNATQAIEIQETFDANLLTAFITNAIFSVVFGLAAILFHRLFPQNYFQRCYVGARTLMLSTRRRARLAVRLEQLKEGGGIQETTKEDSSSSSSSSDTDSDSGSNSNSDRDVEKKASKKDHKDKSEVDEPFPANIPAGIAPRWVLDLWTKVDDDSLLETHGLDLVVFLNILRTLVNLSLYIMIPGVFVMIFNALGNEHMDKDETGVTGTAIISLNNVPSGSWLMIVHTLAMVGVSVMIWWVLFREKIHFMRLRQRWRSLPWNRATAQTVMFTAAPVRDVTNSTSAMRFLRHVQDAILHNFPAEDPNDVLKTDDPAQLAHSEVQMAYMPTNLNEIAKIHEKRQKAALALEKAVVKDRDALQKWKDEGKEKGEEKPEPVECHTGLPLISEKKPAQKYLSGQLRRFDRVLARMLRETQQDTVVDGVYANEPAIYMPGGLKGKKDDEDYSHDEEDEELFAEDPPAAGERHQNARDAASRVVFATYSSPAMAAMAGQTAVSLNSTEWKAHPAVEPEAVVWENLHFAGSHQKAVRMWAGRIIIVLLILFWMIPVGLVSAVSNIKTLSSVEWLEWLVFLIELNPVISGIISGLLPQLALIVFMALLIPIIYAIVYKLQGRTTRQSGEAAVFQYFFAFQVVNVFLGSILAGSAFKIIEYASDFNLLIEVLSQSLPPLVGFFISYVLLQGTTGKFVQAWRPVSVIIYQLKVRLLAKSERDYEANRLPLHYMFPKELAATLLIFVICITYVIIAPLIVPFGLLAQVIFYTLKKRDVLYCFSQRWDSGGSMFIPFVKSTYFGLMVGQLVMVGVFGLKEFAFGSTVALILFLITFVLFLRLPIKLSRGVYYGGLREVTRSTVSHDAVENRLQLQDCYMHPAMRNATEECAQPLLGQDAVEDLKDMCLDKSRLDDFVAHMHHKAMANVARVELEPIIARAVPDQPFEYDSDDEFGKVERPGLLKKMSAIIKKDEDAEKDSDKKKDSKKGGKTDKPVKNGKKKAVPAPESSSSESEDSSKKATSSSSAASAEESPKASSSSSSAAESSAATDAPSSSSSSSSDE